MGSVSLKIGDGTARFKRSSLCSSAVNIMMLFSVVTTNLFALYAFTYNNNTNTLNPSSAGNSLHTTLISDKISEIMSEINSNQKKLSQIESDILGYQTLNISSYSDTRSDLKSFLEPHQLPLGKDSRSGITQMTASVGHMCGIHIDILTQYMNYKVYGHCPDDWAVGQKLISRGCEPLPRRRCLSSRSTLFSKGRQFYYNLPKSLWLNVSDKDVNWNGYDCKNFTCLNKKKNCLGCFDLSSNGNEYKKFVSVFGKNDFSIDDVLGLVNGDRVRIGLDLSGNGSPGTFAARMWEKNVTVVTQTLNIDGPFNEFIAARGLFPLYMSLDYRFPFYDNFFDLVHVGSALDVGKSEKIEFLMFDIDRVLRVGGLFWLDNFHCVSEEKKRDLTRLIERFGFKKLKWVVGEKVVGGSGKSEVYLSAVLQKPVRA